MGIFQCSKVETSFSSENDLKFKNSYFLVLSVFKLILNILYNGKAFKTGVKILPCMLYDVTQPIFYMQLRFELIDL